MNSLIKNITNIELKIKFSTINYKIFNIDYNGIQSIKLNYPLSIKGRQHFNNEIHKNNNHINRRITIYDYINNSKNSEIINRWPVLYIVGFLFELVNIMDNVEK